MLFGVKRVKTLRFDDLAITRGVTVFANSVRNHLAHLVAQFAVLASVFGDQNKVIPGFKLRPHEMTVAVEYLHACICQNYRVESVISRSLEGFLIDKTAVRLSCLYHFNCQILISHGTRSFHLDEQVGGQKFGCKCQVGGIYLIGVILTRFHGLFVARQVTRHDF